MKFGVQRFGAWGRCGTGTGRKFFFGGLHHFRFLLPIILLWNFFGDWMIFKTGWIFFFTIIVDFLIFLYYNNKHEDGNHRMMVQNATNNLILNGVFCTFIIAQNTMEGFYYKPCKPLIGEYSLKRVERCKN